MIVTINDRTIPTPDSWNDLSPTEAVTLYQLIAGQEYTFFLEEETISDFLRIEAAKYLLRIDDEFLAAWEADAKAEDKEDGDVIFADELKQVAQAVTGFLFIEEGSDQISLGLTKIPYKRLVYRSQVSKNKKRYIYGPADGLENISLYELGITFSLFERYVTSRDENFLNRLLSVLFRPHKPKTAHNTRSNYEGDVRLPHYKHESTVTRRMPVIRRLPPLVKSILLFWFASCRHHIINSYPNLFNAQDEAGERQGNDYGWGGVLLSLSGGLIHLREISEQPWQTGFTYLSYLEDQRKLAELRQRRTG